jgi:hypothetical protein
MVFATISCRASRSLKIIRDDFHVMDYTKLISEKHFSVGYSLVIVLPLGEQDSSNNEVFYLVKELHALVRWSVLVFNARYEMEANMFIETHKHGNYIILMSGPCHDWEEHTSRFRQQLSKLRFGNTGPWWNPRAKFLVSVMSNCTHFESTLISRVILNEFWFHGVLKATVLFMKSSEDGGKEPEQNKSNSKQDRHMELHTSFPYENSQRCDPAEGTLTVKVFPIRNPSDIRKSDVFKGHFIKNLHGSPIRVQASISPPFLLPPKFFWFNDSYYYYSYEDGWEIELIRIIGKSLNASFVIEDENNTEYLNGTPYIFIGGFLALNSEKGYEFTRSYHTSWYVWYTQYAVKYQRWSRFFEIFPVDVWISLAFSLVLGVIIVRCISKCTHKLNLNESKTYNNILSIAANTISVLLSVSVNTHPRSTPIRVFFFCRVCISFAISTVFQAYLTSYLIEPGYEVPIKTLDEMLKKIGFTQGCELFYANSSDSVDLAIYKGYVRCPDPNTCFKWASVYHISTILNDFRTDGYRKLGVWTVENKSPLLCELEDGLVGKIDVLFLVNEENPLLECVNDAISHVVEGGIFMQLKERYYEKEKTDPKFDSSTFVDTYYAYSIRQLETVFYLLLMGYLLALTSFMIEAMWHCYRSKGPEKDVHLFPGQT